MNNSILALRHIVQHASRAESHEEQTQRIVDSVCEAVDADICSLYAVDAQMNLILLASHGLTINRAAVIPSGSGLVGLVARSRQIINIEDASQHPDYHYVAGSNEERFPGFCAVPVVGSGKIIGVLVVQIRSSKKVDATSKAFLETLAAHLALTLEKFIFPSLKLSPNIRISGVSGSSGVGIGTARLNNPARLTTVVIEKCEDVVNERAAWHELLVATGNQIRSEFSALSPHLPTEVAGIFDAYDLLLKDYSLIEWVENEIRKGYALTSALRLGIEHFAGLFENMEDPYLRARHEDIRHLGDKLYQVWLKEHRIEKAATGLEGPFILIGESLSISDIAVIPSGQLQGVICAEGSALSHIAVLTGALGIPSVMGFGAVKDLVEGEMLIVDGNQGCVIRQPDSSVEEEYRDLASSFGNTQKLMTAVRDLPAVTRDGVRIAMLANTGLTEDLAPGIANGAEGIGLYRTEIPFMIRQSLPTESEQIEVYQRVLSAYPKQPVYIRTLDIGADKPLPYLPAIKEQNPALGLRGIRFTLDYLPLLMTQLRAILRAAAGREDVRLLLPMISSTAELDQAIGLLDDAVAQLKKDGEIVVRPLIGVMVEVPAAISLLPFWKDKIDFVSIGSNDLSQYVLALDRNNPLVARLYDSVHPSVLHEIKRIVDIANDNDLPLSVCGEMASDPIAVMLLVGMGARTLSMSSAKIPLVKTLIRAASMTELQALFAESRTMDNAISIRVAGQKFMQQLGVA
ncbi:MAG: phosphoenolpyruvate-protein phosphotransferase [Candidatus Azotimanducaceae bacterium]|jgi:phosphoenolpyruvate-protein phosphotransferase